MPDGKTEPSGWACSCPLGEWCEDREHAKPKADGIEVESDQPEQLTLFGDDLRSYSKATRVYLGLGRTP